MKENFHYNKELKFSLSVYDQITNKSENLQTVWYKLLQWAQLGQSSFSSQQPV